MSSGNIGEWFNKHNIHVLSTLIYEVLFDRRTAGRVSYKICIMNLNKLFIPFFSVSFAHYRCSLSPNFLFFNEIIILALALAL